ncbi:MAG: hypothetical protein JOZ02_20275 [Acidobacteria bacterium]|nr:hypothetical protein [Acidobacteriota bacterium]
MRRVKAAGLLLLIVCLLTAGGSALLPNGVCPAGGAAVTPGGREFARLKNRTALPEPADFDGNVSLEALLRPGEDLGRWSESRAGSIEGYVVEVKAGGVEAANCYSYRERDVHIHVAARPDAPRTEWLVVEVTPRARRRAAESGLDWSMNALREKILGRRCRFEGWLLFDREHADESENTASGARGDWRATAWELHPITSIEVLK